MRLVQAYTEELKWRDGNYVPKTLEEHLGVSARSSGGFTLASASLFAGVGGIATTDTFEWILNYPQLFKTFDMFVRFSNDIVSSQVLVYLYTFNFMSLYMHFFFLVAY